MLFTVILLLFLAIAPSTDSGRPADASKAEVYKRNYANDTSFWPVVVNTRLCNVFCKLKSGCSEQSCTDYSEVTIRPRGMKAKCKCLHKPFCQFKFNSFGNATGRRRMYRNYEQCWIESREAYALNSDNLVFNVFSVPTVVCVQWKCDRFCQTRFAKPGLCQRHFWTDEAECYCLDRQPIKIMPRVELPPLADQLEKGEIYNGVLNCKAASCQDYCNFAYGSGNPQNGDSVAAGVCRFYKLVESVEKHAVVAFCACKVSRWKGQDVSNSHGDVAHVTSQCHVIKPERDQALVTCNPVDCNLYCHAEDVRSASLTAKNVASRATGKECDTERLGGECRNITSWTGTEDRVDSVQWSETENEGELHEQRIGCFCRKGFVYKTTTTSAPENLDPPDDD